MKKIGLVLILGLLIFSSSACSVNVVIDTKDDTEKKVETVEKSTETAKSSDKEINEDNANTSASSEAFYGVWCSGSKSKSDAENVANDLVSLGFDAQVFVTTDWENLNPEKFYVVTAGVCNTKQEAEQLLSSVKSNGFSDAYVKYSGKRK